MSLPDSNYVACFPLQEYFVDKDTGEPLSGGVVSFYSDQSFTVPKNVYKQTYVPSNQTYTYENIGSVLTLSSVGTFMDDTGNDIIPFLFPYEGTEAAPGDVQLYFIKVENSSGTLQFTRDGWPPLGFSSSSSGADAGNENIISNPQFSDILFNADPTSGVFTFNVSTSNQETFIAPNWSIVTSGTGTVSVKQVALAPTGSSDVIPTNPPYCIDITSTGITNIKLRQRLTSTPLIFYGGNINSQFMAQGQGSTLAIACEMHYVPSAGDSYTIIDSDTTRSSGEWTQFNQSIALGDDPNTDTAPSGYIDIEILFEALKNIRITSVQIIEVGSTSDTIAYQQETIDRQTDHLFHYYKPELEYKPIPSYLVGWDFPLNPAQEAGRTVAASAIGANKSKYVWDQTIIFQSADSGVDITGGTAGELIVTAAATTQAAIIQYLPATTAKKILNEKICVNIAAKASTNLVVGCSLWYTSGTLPDLTANNSIVAGLNATGAVQSTNDGPWLRVPRRGITTNQPLFTVETNATTQFNDYAFSGWDLEGAAAADTATFFAIVISTASMAMNDTLSLYSVGLYNGDIPTRPAPLTIQETLSNCQYYYQKSFPIATIPAQNAGVSSASIGNQIAGAAVASAGGPIVRFPTIMRSASATITLYNPANTNAQIRGAGSDWSSSVVAVQSEWGFRGRGTTPGGSSAGDICTVHWTADARLGIV